jgi:hypothetical protein
MTVDTLVAAPVTLPRVNLLPQEINAASAARKAKMGLALVVVLAVVGVGYMYTSASASVTSAQTDLDTAKNATAQLQRTLQQHNTVQPLKKELTDRTALLSGAMERYVPWARYLNDIQLGLPRGARLVTWQIQLTAPSAATNGTGAFGAGGVAAWTITGEAKRYEDVALVIESLQQLNNVDSVAVTKASDALDPSSGQKIVQFTLSARVNDNALASNSNKVGG